MPRRGMAHCNRVQRLLYYYYFFPSIKGDGQPRRAAAAALLRCSQRNQKLMPAAAGPKTNALQPLLDRHETLLLCWKNWKRYQRQTVRLHRPLWKRLGVSPASAASVPDLYVQQNTCIWSLFAKFFIFENYILYEPRTLSQFLRVADALSSPNGELGTWMRGLKRSPSGSKLQSRSFPKRLQLWKSTEEEWPRWKSGLHHSSCLSDHTTYMQTSTVMNLLCVYVCI